MPARQSSRSSERTSGSHRLQGRRHGGLVGREAARNEPLSTHPSSRKPCGRDTVRFLGPLRRRREFFAARRSNSNGRLVLPARSSSATIRHPMSTRRKATEDVKSQTRKGSRPTSCNAGNSRAAAANQKWPAARSRERHVRKNESIDGAALKAVPGSSRGVRKGATDASPRHPCGEARLGSRSDRAAKATSLQAPRSSQPPRSMRWCQRRRDRPPERVSPAYALFLREGDRDLVASTSSERSGTLSPVASCDTRQLNSVNCLKERKALTGGANWLRRRSTARCGTACPVDIRVAHRCTQRQRESSRQRPAAAVLARAVQRRTRTLPHGAPLLVCRVSLLPPGARQPPQKGHRLSRESWLNRGD